jgi:hypothetical protein
MPAAEMIWEADGSDVVVVGVGVGEGLLTEEIDIHGLYWMLGGQTRNNDGKGAVLFADTLTRHAERKPEVSPVKPFWYLAPD